jgi:hypothetical protein
LRRLAAVLVAALGCAAATPISADRGDIRSAAERHWLAYCEMRQAQ